MKITFSTTLALLAALSLVSCSASQPRTSIPTTVERSQPSKETKSSSEETSSESETGFKEVKLCATEDGCTEELATVETTMPVFYLIGNMGTLSEGSLLKGTLIYREGPVGQDIEIASTDLEKKPFLNVFTFTFSAPEEGWPPGKYEVTISSNAEGIEPVSKFFTVE
jgi:hypothetical protein